MDVYIYMTAVVESFSTGRASLHACIPESVRELPSLKGSIRARTLVKAPSFLL